MTKALVLLTAASIALPLFASMERKQSGCADAARSNTCIENEEKAYGALHGRIVGRIRLWPGLAPRETESSLGRYAYDERCKVWRRRDVSQPELVIFRPSGKPQDTVVIVMPGGGYDSQYMGHFSRDSKPILDSRSEGAHV